MPSTSSTAYVSEAAKHYDLLQQSSIIYPSVLSRYVSLPLQGLPCSKGGK